MSKQTSISDISKLLKSYEDLSIRFNKLETEVIELRSENKALRKENRQLKQENKALRNENKVLRKENKRLQERVAKLEHKKNSTNSSMPPSSDMTKHKRTQSLRKSSEKKVGGQVGHAGSTLKMTDVPDQIKDYYPNVCSHCGRDLSEVTAKFSGRRQVIDIPPIRQVVTEYRIHSKQCSCGACTQSEYPEVVKSPVSYGSNLQSLIAYLNARQYLPINRIHELFTDVLNINISEGGICYLLDKMARKGNAEYERIKTAVMQEKVIGADETGANINGDNHWFWTFQSNLYTFIGFHKSRGFKAIEDLVGNNFDNACIVSDCWSPYFKTNANNHQLCLAHLQRELIDLTQRYPKQTWTLKFNNLLYKAYKLTQKYIEIPLELSKKINPVLNKFLHIFPPSKIKILRQ